jgi:glutathione S-transferase
MLTLFHAPWSRSGRIVWLLEELGLDYDLHYVGIFRARDGSGRRDPSNPHPDGKVPALRHDDALVTESAAVALYLTDLVPESPLTAAPGSPERAAYLTWLAWTTGEMEPALWARISGSIHGDPMMERRFDDVVARLLGALDKGPYLMGERFTAIDVMVGSALAWAREFLPQSAQLDAYLARVLERPANQRATAKDGAPPVGVEVA